MAREKCPPGQTRYEGKCIREIEKEDITDEAFEKRKSKERIGGMGEIKGEAMKAWKKSGGDLDKYDRLTAHLRPKKKSQYQQHQDRIKARAKAKKAKSKK